MLSQSKKEENMPESFEFMQRINTRQFLLSTVRDLLPSMILSIVCMLIIYNLLHPYFPPTSIIPLLAASLCPLLANVVSIVRRRHLDVFAMMILLGLAVSILGALLGGNQQLLLIRESFVTGAIGLAFLVSLLLPKSFGYYFARQFMTANDPKKSEGFATLWETPYFQHVIRGGTIFWGLLLVGEFVLRVVMVLTLPIPVVLAVSPIVFNACIFVGIAVSAVWAKSAIQHIRK